jgi:hypothetical protein
MELQTLDVIVRIVKDHIIEFLFEGLGRQVYFLSIFRPLFSRKRGTI